MGGGATPETSTNGAIYLNEPDGVGTTVVGFNPALTYSLSFTYWGDNQPGESYSLYVSVNATVVDTIVGVDQNPGTKSGNARDD